MEIIKIEHAFNPKTGEYESFLQIRTKDEHGNLQNFYTYEVFKVPVYRVNEDGTRTLIRYKYYWIKTPHLSGIVADANGLKMVFTD